jgi:phage protein D
MARAHRDEPLVPACAVSLDGVRLEPDVMLWVTGVSVEDQLDEPGRFAFGLISREDEDGSFPWTDDERFAFGARVEVSFGYGDDLERVISGEITALEPAFSIGGAPTLTVRGCDKRYLLNTEPRSRTFIGQTDKQIAEEIGRTRNPVIEATETGVTLPFIMQKNQTDLQFLIARARQIHYQITMRGDTLVYAPVASASARVATLSFSDDLLDFRACRAIVPMSATKVQSPNPQNKEPFTATFDARGRAPGMGGRKSAAEQARDTIGATVESVVGEPAGSQAETDQRAEALFNAASLNHVLGDGRCFGRTDVRPGTVIGIEEVGDRLSGDYFVTSTAHSYTQREGYITTFRLRRNAS